jgi:hypothetical protein
MILDCLCRHSVDSECSVRCLLRVGLFRCLRRVGLSVACSTTASGGDLLLLQGLGMVVRETDLMDLLTR